MLLVVSIHFLILTILGCLENFSMHAKTGLWVVLGRCVSSTSISLEMISIFSTSVIFFFWFNFVWKKGRDFFPKFFIDLNKFHIETFKIRSFFKTILTHKFLSLIRCIIIAFRSSFLTKLAWFALRYFFLKGAYTFRG